MVGRKDLQSIWNQRCLMQRLVFSDNLSRCKMQRLMMPLGSWRRFLSRILIPPRVDTRTHIGLACQGCKSLASKGISAEQCCALADRRDQMYTEMGFFEHLEHCPEAQSLLECTSESNWDWK